MAEAADRWPPRDRMVYSAAQLIRERGVTATGVRDVVAHANAPRGSFAHYFPGGKDQLVEEALAWSADFAVDAVQRYLDGARRPSPSGLFDHLIGQWKREFGSRGFERGCPIMATAADVAADRGALDRPLRSALADWENAIFGALTSMEIPGRTARRLAVLMLSSLEGAIMLARVQRSVTPLTVVGRELGPLLDATVPARTS